MEDTSNQSIFHATGKRKCAIARVKICTGTGQIIINNKEAVSYLQYSPRYFQSVKDPLTLTKTENELDVQVTCLGGGIASQAGAIRLGISRALCLLNKDFRSILKIRECLSRDSRIKERRKYGLKKARKAPQYSKR